MMGALHLRPMIWAVIMVAVGFAFGLGYFAALREGCTRLLAGRRGALLLTAVRLLAMGALLILAAQRGAAALLAAFAGVLLARGFAVGAR